MTPTRPAQSYKPSDERVVSVGPYAGMDRSTPPRAMGMAYSPDAVNMEPDGGWLHVRNPPAQLAPSSSGRSFCPQGVGYYNGFTYLVWRTTSNNSIFVGADAIGNFANGTSSLSTATGSGTLASSQISYSPIQLVVAPDAQNSGASLAKATCFLLHGDLSPTVFFQVPVGQPGHSSSLFSLTPFTAYYSLSSTARLGTSVNERLVLFGLDQNNRVAWSVRGAPRDFSSEGAGFIDLPMQGVPRACLADGDRAVFLTDSEVWEGRARGDAFAFDFKRLAEIGEPLADTAVETPLGPVWIGPGRQPYVLNGAQPVPVAHGVPKLFAERWTYNVTPSRAVYDAGHGDYVLFWRDVQLAISRASSAALDLSGINSFLRLNVQRSLLSREAWTNHHFSTSSAYTYYAGSNLVNLGGGVGLGTSFTRYGMLALNTPTPDGHGVALFWNADPGVTSDKSTFKQALLYPDSSADGWASNQSEWGAPVQAYWTTPCLGRNDLERETVAGVWIDYQSPTASVLSVLASDDGQSFQTIGSISLSATSYVPGATSGLTNYPTSQVSTAYAPMTSRAFRNAQLRIVAAPTGPNMRLGPMRIALKSYTGRF